MPHPTTGTLRWLLEGCIILCDTNPSDLIGRIYFQIWCTTVPIYDQITATLVMKISILYIIGEMI